MDAMVVPEPGGTASRNTPSSTSVHPGYWKRSKLIKPRTIRLREVSTRTPPYPVRVAPAGRENSSERWSVVPGMRPINDTHVAEPGLAVVEVAAADDETAFAVQELLATRCAVAAADRTIHEPGEPGVRLRCYLDLRQQPDA
ncbi:MULTISPECIES: DUF6207 family protein [unclassified Streptomyces]|uniref:DUF6207 family protein n=1 Tax=unclassified Streptomyces TaxID=2593676 RepID=UPI0020B784B8|nr:DUF6207 family protein [Streptomyces sp. AC558_RSS880]